VTCGDGDGDGDVGGMRLVIIQRSAGLARALPSDWLLAKAIFRKIQRYSKIEILSLLKVEITLAIKSWYLYILPFLSQILYIVYIHVSS